MDLLRVNSKGMRIVAIRFRVFEIYELATNIGPS